MQLHDIAEVPSRPAIECNNGHSKLTCFKHELVSRSREVILPQSFLRTVRPHVECCVQFWDTQCKGDMDKLERVQQRVTKMFKGLKHDET